MALRLRRGTNADRLLKTFAEGELIYVTDHIAQSVPPLWIGDGTTPGGVTADSHTDGTIGTLGDVDITGITDNQVLKWVAANSRFEPVDISQLNEGATELNDLTDVDLVTVSPDEFSANVLKYNGTQFVPSELALDDIAGVYYIDLPKLGDFLIHDGFNFVPTQIEQQNWKINIVGDDSTIIIDTDTNTITGNFFGDVTGSVFGDDSSVLVDGVNSVLTGKIKTTSKVEIEDIEIGLETVNPQFSYYSTATNGLFPVSVVNIGNIHDDAFANELSLYKSRGTLANQTIVQAGDTLGSLTWAGYDGNIAQISGCIKSEVNSASLNNISADVIIATRNGDISTYTETIRFKSDSGTVAQGYVQFGSLTSTERNALTPAAGMVIWNSTTTQFEGFDGTNWINLVDGITSV